MKAPEDVGVVGSLGDEFREEMMTQTTSLSEKDSHS